MGKEKKKRSLIERLRFLRRSITFKIVVLIVGTILIVVSSIAFLSIRHGISQIEKELTLRGQLLSRYLANISYDAILKKDDYRLIDIIDIITKEPDVGAAMIVDTTGTIIAHSNNDLYNTKLKNFVPIEKEKMDDNNKKLVFYYPVEEGARGYVTVTISKDRIANQVTDIVMQLGLVAFIILAVGAVNAIFFSFQLIKPIRNLKEGAEAIADKNYSHRINIKRKDEWNILSGAFNKMAGEIQDFTGNLEKKVEERTEELNMAMQELKLMNVELAEARDAIWGEMELAKKIQTALLPEEPAIKGYEISAYMKPADLVGGDYYDIINTAGKDWVIIGDVSGHGVPAGLIMMMVQTSIQFALNQQIDLSPSELLAVVNTTISDNIKKLDEDKYMTITAIACHEQGKLLFSGLHQDIMVYRQASGDVELVETRGLWIGLGEDIKDVLHNDSIDLAVGDAVLLYTDGISESIDSDGTLYSDEKLLDIFKDSGKGSTEEIKKTILDSVEGYTCHDDITMVLFKRLK
ncbi:MAG: SpoIIE family protein phosphatase [bacterium]|nr:SpoIIE family protein phosphatase [bacterium]